MLIRISSPIYSYVSFFHSYLLPKLMSPKSVHSVYRKALRLTGVAAKVVLLLHPTSQRSVIAMLKKLPHRTTPLVVVSFLMTD